MKLYENIVLKQQLVEAFNLINAVLKDKTNPLCEMIYKEADQVAITRATSDLATAEKAVEDAKKTLADNADEKRKLDLEKKVLAAEEVVLRKKELLKKAEDSK